MGSGGGNLFLRWLRGGIERVCMLGFRIRIDRGSLDELVFEFICKSVNDE